MRISCILELQLNPFEVYLLASFSLSILDNPLCPYVFMAQIYLW